MILRERRLGVGKAWLTLCSVGCFVWASCGFRAFGVLRVLGLRAFWVVRVYGFSLLLCFCFSFVVSVRSFLCILLVHIGMPYTFFNNIFHYLAKKNLLLYLERRMLLYHHGCLQERRANLNFRLMIWQRCNS